MSPSLALSEFAFDVRFALRQLRTNRSFATVAILTLALGIGATTTLFTVLHAVVLRPLPFPEADRLIDIATESRGEPGAISVGNYYVIRERARSFESLAARSGATFNLTENGEPERIAGAHVTASYFDVLGIRPALGRTFTAGEDQPGDGALVAVLSHSLFMRRFGGDPSVVGRRLILNNRPYVVLGVMPKEFEIPEDPTQLWTPIAFGAEHSFDAHYFTLTARLKASTSAGQLKEDVAAITTALLEAAPRDNEGRVLIVNALLDRIVGDYRVRLAVLLGAVCLVFLIACVNVASLLMARGAARRREITVRAALGAGRMRIARQMMTEALVLSGFGAVGGVGLAAVALPLFVAHSPADVPRIGEAGLNAEALGLASFAALLATLIAGLVPALRESRAGLASGAGQASRGSAGSVGTRARQAFVAAEVGLALMLLMGAGLMIRSGQNLGRVEKGFDPTNLISGRIALPITAYPGEERPASAAAAMVENLRGAHGVAEAAASTRPPLIGDVDYGLRIEGREDAPSQRINARMQLVTPRYLEVMRVPLRRGRTFTDDDRRSSPRVMVVSETLARLAWPDQDPIGKRIACCEGSRSDPAWKEVVGVAADTRARGIAAPSLPEFYLPMDQAPRRAFEANGGSITLVARATRGTPEALAPALREAVRAVDAAVPLYDVATMASRVEASTAVMRFNRMLLSCLALAGLALAGIGIYGVIAYLVSQRTKEIGVRIALGARPRDVIGMVTRQGVGAISWGVLLGGLGTLAQARAMESLLFGISGRDPFTLLATASILVILALAAGVLPALGASRIDPAKVLTEP